MDIRRPFRETEEELKKRLTAEQYQVCRSGGTEAAGSGRYVDDKTRGFYRCVVCGNFLFSSKAKFDSGTGWPSFDEALPGSVKLKKEDSFGQSRLEVSCANCASHLGHLFFDGPTGTGKRYCLNSICLQLEKNE